MHGSHQKRLKKCCNRIGDALNKEIKLTDHLETTIATTIQPGEIDWSKWNATLDYLVQFHIIAVATCEL